MKLKSVIASIAIVASLIGAGVMLNSFNESIEYISTTSNDTFNKVQDLETKIDKLKESNEELKSSNEELKDTVSALNGYR